jgi:hypothetical protein
MTIEAQKQNSIDETNFLIQIFKENRFSDSKLDQIGLKMIFSLEINDILFESCSFI